jgi:uncharacterized protein YhjY with autotransporter beta-barrel domain
VVAAAPTVANISASVAANSSSNTLPLSITGSATSVAVTSGPVHGTITISGTSILYTPTAGFAGADSLSYTATNSGGTSSAATISIRVTAPPVTAPVAADIAASVSANSSNNALRLAITGTATSVAVISAPSHGAVTVSGTAILYTPAAGYTGPDTLTYAASNLGGTSAAATASITVNAPPVTAPTVANVSASVVADSSNNLLTLSVTGKASSVAVTSPPSHGTVSVAGINLTYTPAPGYVGADSFTYTATNGGGSSGAATVSVKITEAPLALQATAPDVLASGAVAKALNMRFAASGGVSPYTYSATSLPADLSLTPEGVLSGMPTVSGTYSFKVTAMDARSAKVTTGYTLTVAAAGPESLPLAADRTVLVNAGQSVTVDLAKGLAGGVPTAATLLTKPDAAQGTASINGMSLNFAAKAQASGALTLQYALSNANGTSNPATLTVRIIGRSDPSQDPQVIGLVNAQAQSALQFAGAQISNFNHRLEHLHNEAQRRSRLFDVSISAPQANRNQQSPDSNASYKPASGVAEPSDPAAASQRENVDMPLVLWTGGYVNFTNADRQAMRLDHTTVGLSGGADYRFSQTIVAGLGLGVGHDASDVADAGTRSNGKAASVALYASYHASPWYLDGQLGYSHLNFDSRRALSDATGFADGSRNGQQVFGAISSGYEFQAQGVMLAPYGRVQFSSSSLRHYTESGAGIYDLAYANQRVSTLAAVLGLRSQYGVPMSWGRLRLTGRVEYSDAIRKDSVARLGYADQADNAYAVQELGVDQNRLSIEAGVEFVLQRGWKVGVSYQGAASLDGGTRENALLLHSGWNY